MLRTSDALRLCRYVGPDVLVLDLEWPGEEAKDLIQLVREADRGISVIVLVPRGRLAGRDLGADDALARPFPHGVLRSRIDTVLGRRHRRSDKPLRVGPILVDPGGRRVLVGDRKVALTRTEFTLLRALAGDPTKVFSKEELLRKAWGPRVDRGKTRTLESHASRLRRKLDPEETRFVINHYGIGYSLMAEDSGSDSDDDLLTGDRDPHASKFRRPSGPLDGAAWDVSG